MAEFDSADLVPVEKIRSLRWTASEQALFYRDNRERLCERYGGSFIFLQRGQVVWSGPEPHKAGTVEKVSGGENEAVWLKLVDPEELEGERMAAYEKVLAV